MRILLLSAYDAPSHRRWREGLVRCFHEHHWTVLTLPPRHFAWRSRGNALTWALGEREILNLPFDLVVATSMTDLASLRGMAPTLARVPAIVYFHENQFTYPERFERKEYLNYPLTNLYTALSADAVLFNSAYNLDTFLGGTQEMLRAMPDGVPEGAVSAVREKARVLPVPLEDECFTRKPARKDGALVIAWNHRWEHDKAPDRFFAALERLSGKNLPFKVHVLGQRFRSEPPVFSLAKEKLDRRIGEWGFVEDRAQYRRILGGSDVIVSTALHDFQGLAVMEAAAAGCLPLVPDRLAYREVFPDSCRFPSTPDDPEAEASVLAGRLALLCADPGKTRSLTVPDLARFSWHTLGPAYRTAFEETARTRPRAYTLNSCRP
jgi:glycosyltransferase involved in cell wall biosynthesis